MATKPIKTDLFRFVTLRAPQLINEERKALGFIYHPNAGKSLFLKSVKPNNTIEVSRTAVREQVSKLSNPFATYLKVKAVDKEMYNFSSWLMDNRNTLTKAEVLTEISGITRLSTTKLIEIWDNLFYQVLTRKSSYVRQACIQMLMAHNFVEKHTTYNAETAKNTENEFLIRLANAKVVIDKAFTIAKSNTTPTNGSNKAVAKTIERAVKRDLAQQEVTELNLAKSELKIADKAYQKAYNIAQENARSEYESTTKPLIEAAKKKQKRLQKEENQLAFKQKREPREIGIELDLPEFEFTFDSPFDRKYLKNLSENTIDLLDELKLKDEDTIGSAIIGLDGVIAAANTDLFNNTNTTDTTVYVGGTPIKSNLDINLKPYCFFINTIAKRKKGVFSPLLHQVVLTVNLGALSFPVSETHTIVYGSTTVTSTQSLKQQTQGGNTY